MQVKMVLTFKLVEGEPIKDPDYVLDAFAATVGRQNGAGNKALRVSVSGGESFGDFDEKQSVYEVDLVDAP